MPDGEDVPLFIDCDVVFGAAAGLRTDCAASELPPIEPPDVRHAGLDDVLWRVSFLARGCRSSLATQFGVVADAIVQGAVDAQVADRIEVVDD